MATVVLVGTLDTKGVEYAYFRDRVREQGLETILIDAGVMGALGVTPDIAHDEVARAGGVDAAELAVGGDRGVAVQAMARGARAVVARLYAEGRLDGIAALGGSGGSSIAAEAMKALPVGVPKLIVSTVASGDTRPYVGALDVTMTYSVVDIAGINQLSARIIANAAGAIAGMVKVPTPPVPAPRPLVAASMFGVTTPAVAIARQRLEELGYEVLVFHQTGTGGESMEELMKGGFIAGSLDVTVTELADELVGGVLAAHPKRLEVAGELGIPQVVSLGALDMVNFGPVDTVPSEFRGRNLYVHNATVTLMRTTPAENAELGRRIARKLSAATGPTALFVPLRGVSTVDVEGMPFHDPEADQALFDALRHNLDPRIETHWVDADVNDPAFALAMANRLHELIQQGGATR